MKSKPNLFYKTRAMPYQTSTFYFWQSWRIKSRQLYLNRMIVKLQKRNDLRMKFHVDLESKIKHARWKMKLQLQPQHHVRNPKDESVHLFTLVCLELMLKEHHAFTQNSLQKCYCTTTAVWRLESITTTASRSTKSGLMGNSKHL